MKIRNNALAIVSFFAVMFFSGCDTVGEVVSTIDTGLTDGEIVNGLVEALEIGLDSSVTSASSVNGYLANEAIKIFLPEEVTNLQNYIETESLAGVVPLSTVYDVYIGLENNGSDLFDDLTTAMNRGAESAASKAAPIFGNAITGMTFDDARGILEGNETAATDYFYNTTNVALFDAFSPEIDTALDNTLASDLYVDILGFLNYSYDAGILGEYTVSSYIAPEITQDLPESLGGYATEKAIDGLFHLVGEEEKKIRDDPFAWGSDIIETVFGSILD